MGTSTFRGRYLARAIRRFCKPVAVGVHFIIVIYAIGVPMPIIGKKAEDTLAWILLGPVTRNHPARAACAASIETCRAVQDTRHRVRFFDRDPMHVIEASMVEILRQKTITQTPKLPRTIRLAEKDAAKCVHSNHVQVGKQ